MNWVKEYGKKIESLKKAEGSIDVVEMDEMHSYVSGKKTIAGYGWLLIGLGKESSISCWVPAERKRA